MTCLLLLPVIRVLVSWSISLNDLASVDAFILCQAVYILASYGPISWCSYSL